MDKPGKIAMIVEYFGFRTLDEATLNLSNALLHFKQEGLTEESMNAEDSEAIVETVYRRIVLDNDYEKPIGHCAHFAKLLQEIAGYPNIGYDCEIVRCKPDYLNGHRHCLVYDKTQRRYRDPSIYRTVFSNGKWIPIEESGIDRNNIPEDSIHEEWST